MASYIIFAVSALGAPLGALIYLILDTRQREARNKGV
ncbi:hypothetical protein UFOVP786_26 [uncultured Caudovirales phage]|uniref:Uncharacterized protein n=1 Tax=uncultured Caudovirales phage TaxID=2100421 RepID=A0A6J5NTH9_9CAUD|nr:hypothetical protein UFOVP786_26 [uncultured Caudovirales phage]